MQKKEGIKLASGASKKLLRSRPTECQKTPFRNVRKILHLSKSSPKAIYYIVLYSINIVFGIISSTRYWKI